MFLLRLNVVHPVNDEGFRSSRVHLSENNGKILVAAKTDRTPDFGDKIPNYPGSFPDSFAGGGDAFLPQEGPAFLQVGGEIFIDILMNFSDLFSPAHFLLSPAILAPFAGKKEIAPSLQTVDRPLVTAKFILSGYHDSQSAMNGEEGYCFSFKEGE
jgi:hypothetical protein